MVTHLQYANDTLLLKEVLVDNIWIIIDNLRALEITYGPRVNFSKSRLIGVNVEPTFMTLARDFVHSTIKTFHFKYLDLLVGVELILSLRP